MIQNLVFDIGGVIIDDGDAPLLKTLGLPLDDMKKLEGLLYNNPRWSEDCCTTILAGATV